MTPRSRTTWDALIDGHGHVPEERGDHAEREHRRGRGLAPPVGPEHHERPGHESDQGGRPEVVLDQHPEQLPLGDQHQESRRRPRSRPVPPRARRRRRPPGPRPVMKAARDIAVARHGAAAIDLRADLDGGGLLPARSGDAFAAHDDGSRRGGVLHIGEQLLLHVVGTELAQQVGFSRLPGEHVDRLGRIGLIARQGPREMIGSGLELLRGGRAERRPPRPRGPRSPASDRRPGRMPASPRRPPARRIPRRDDLIRLLGRPRRLAEDLVDLLELAGVVPGRRRRRGRRSAPQRRPRGAGSAAIARCGRPHAPRQAAFAAGSSGSSQSTSLIGAKNLSRSSNSSSPPRSSLATGLDLHQFLLLVALDLIDLGHEAVGQLL